MNELMNTVRERLWPSRAGARSDHSRRLLALQAVIAVVITVAYGPEIFAAMEMTALLELLGASLFLTAFGAGLRLKLIEVFRALRSVLAPVGQLDLIRANARPRLKAQAAVSIAINATWCFCAFVVAGAFSKHLLDLAH